MPAAIWLNDWLLVSLHSCVQSNSHRLDHCIVVATTLGAAHAHVAPSHGAGTGTIPTPGSPVISPRNNVTVGFDTELSAVHAGCVLAKIASIEERKTELDKAAKGFEIARGFKHELTFEKRIEQDMLERERERES